ncbi:epsin [Mytilus galloprovincialis]|uniref:Epsin n=1 Tax=Mytilus galloprovincialis TaxID=29158 RepID=A0A8B6GBS8_MYTGA|nr:epsin [Mytilus galloprovincialis]
MSNMPPIRRTVKNVIHNYSEAQVKVREATSNDPWGPSSTLMSEIADLTYNVVAFTEIMQMIWKRLNDHGKNWRHVYKSLMLLDYIIKTGSEKVAQQCKENIFAIQTLRDFQYREDNKDQGMNVREKAKQLVALLKDDERLRNERAKALKAKERFAQNAMGIGSDDKVRYGRGSPSLSTGAGGGGYTDPYGGGSESGVHSDASSPVEVRRRSGDMVEYARPSSAGEEEIQLQLALAMSKEEHDEELKKQKSDDVKLALALEESRKTQDDERRSKSKTTGQPGGLLTLDSPKQLTTDPWGAPIPAPVANTDPWGAPVQAPAPTTADPWQSPARTVSPAQQQVSADPWGAPLAMPQAPPPYSSVAASDPWITPAASAAVQSQPPRQKSPWDASPTMDNNTGFDNGFGMGASAATTNGQKEDDGFDLLSSRSTGNSPAKVSISHGGLDGFDPLGDSCFIEKENASNFYKSNPGQKGRVFHHSKNLTFFRVKFLVKKMEVIKISSLLYKNNVHLSINCQSGVCLPFIRIQYQDTEEILNVRSKDIMCQNSSLIPPYLLQNLLMLLYVSV